MDVLRVEFNFLMIKITKNEFHKKMGAPSPNPPHSMEL
jgi:hypothetical protein